MKSKKNLGLSLIPALLITFSHSSLANDPALTGNHSNNETSITAGESRDTEQNLSNKAVSASSIKGKFSADKLLKNENIDISVNNNNVHLKGKVKSDAHFERAVMLTRNVQGIRDVDTEELEVVDSKKPLTDSLITAHAKSKIFQLGIFDNEDPDVWSVKVETNNGVVYLTGLVDSDATKNKIITSLSEINNVKGVKADLKIEKEELNNSTSY